MSYNMNLQTGRTTYVPKRKWRAKRNNANAKNKQPKHNPMNRKRRRRRRPRRRRPRQSIPDYEHNLVAMNSSGGELITLHEIMNPLTIDYCEAVVCPFNDRAVGCKRPDSKSGTVGATDRLDAIINSSAISAALPNTSCTGIVLSLVPRSISTGWIEGTVDGQTNEIIPTLPRTELDSALNPLEDTAGEPAVVGDPYMLIFAALGADNQFYRITGSTPAFSVGVNFIRSVRSDSLDTNFDTVRLLGAAFKLWSNEAPINTGGKVFSGAFRAKDLYDIYTNNNSNVNANSLETVLKDQYKNFVGLDGTTVRYKPLQDPDQLKLRPTRLPIIAKYTNTQTYYSISDTYTPQIYDLATPNTFLPSVVWRFGNTDYDLTLKTIFHVEGGTDGSCPFESEQINRDLAITHIDQLLSSNQFPRYVKGHSFKKFIEHAKKFIGHSVKGTAKVLQILQLIEKHAAAL